jgi:hypothetical protein
MERDRDRCPVLPTSTSGLRRRATRLGLMLAISGLAAACASPPPAPPVAMPGAPTLASAPPAPCAEEYRALLDLADLARRYGPSSGIFLDPLGDMFEQLDQCLSAAQDEARPARANLLEISSHAGPPGAGRNPPVMTP